jgi:ubiquinone/menaquinone biosynthesis C-methylase UbiE
LTRFLARAYNDAPRAGWRCCLSYDGERIRGFWDQEDVESMYDKHLLDGEILLIKARIPEGAKVLDAGCGEGEATLAYSLVPGVRIDAFDFSETRLRKARERLRGQSNVSLRQMDALQPDGLHTDYDLVVSQRFLINLTDWELQKQVLVTLMRALRRGGRLLMLEGSQAGVRELDELRAAWGLAPIPVRWHNLFFDDDALRSFMAENGHTLQETRGLGAYFSLTRGVRPALDAELDWNSEFNRLAATQKMEELLGLGPRFSRLRLWVFEK